jgi:hypothetical protein
VDSPFLVEVLSRCHSEAQPKNLDFVTAGKCGMLRFAQHDIDEISRIATVSQGRGWKTLGEEDREQGPALTDILLQAEPLQETQGDFLQTLHHSICFAE